MPSLLSLIINVAEFLTGGRDKHRPLISEFPPPSYCCITPRGPFERDRVERVQLKQCVSDHAVWHVRRCNGIQPHRFSSPHHRPSPACQVLASYRRTPPPTLLNHHKNDTATCGRHQNVDAPPNPRKTTLADAARARRRALATSSPPPTAQRHPFLRDPFVVIRIPSAMSTVLPRAHVASGVDPRRVPSKLVPELDSIPNFSPTATKHSTQPREQGRNNTRSNSQKYTKIQTRRSNNNNTTAAYGGPRPVLPRRASQSSPCPCGGR